MTYMNKIITYLGKAKVWQTSLSSYISILNFVMIFYLYIIESPLGLEWYHWLFLILILVSSVVYIDTKFIMPNALGYTFRKNPEFNELKKLVIDNNKKINKILGEKYE